ncbi:AABR07064386.1 [Phodopus roborovskii]|uniref:AABR07064386.1 protein n=1 Tax=Phodopus roborovskii TaxID=109678 RepID=A0AAU9ZQS7_PHORO|nr:AABR07064386.1 [Phodopus roborovskii]
MSIIPKHFGLTAREESYMFKELEKIRQKSKKECSELKQKLAVRSALGASSEDDLEDQDQDQEAQQHSTQGKGKVSWAAKPPLPSSSKAQSSERSATADLQGAPPSTRRRPVKPLPFRPRDFYLRSSAYLRHCVPREPPAIARQAGTARPVVLLRPRLRLRKPLIKIWGEPVSRRLFAMSPSHEAPGIDVSRQRYRLASSLSSLGSEADESGRLLRKLRIHTYFLREGMSGFRWIRPSSRGGRDGSSTSQATWPLPVARFIPTSIEEIIASLQSEAQLASDQTIKELIQSILGQNYDLTMEFSLFLSTMVYSIPSTVPFYFLLGGLWSLEGSSVSPNEKGSLKVDMHIYTLNYMYYIYI